MASFPAQLRITDGVTPQSLSDAPASLTNYIPSSALGGGVVAETATLVFPSFEAGRPIVEALNRLFEKARRRVRTRTTTRIFVEWRASATEQYWRSEIFDGYASLGGELARTMIVAFIRAPWWEGPETQIPITNTNGTLNTSGLTIDGHTLGGGAPKSSYFTVSSADVSGDMPSPIRLHLVNPNVANLNNFYIGLLKDGDLFTTSAFLQGESANYAIGGSDQTDTGSSNGLFKRTSFNGVAQLVIGWDMVNPLGALNGRWAVPIIRWANTPTYTDVQIRWALYFGAAPIFKSDWQTVSNASQLHVGLPVPFPPRNIVVGSPGVHRLYIEGRKISQATTTLDFDFVQLLAADSFRAYTPVAYYIDQNAQLVDDVIEDLVYYATSDLSGSAPNYVATGDQAMLIPNHSALFGILFDSAGTHVITRTVTAKLYYRPRRQSV